MLVKTLGPKGIKLLDLPLVIFIIVGSKREKNAGLTPLWFNKKKCPWFVKTAVLTPCDIFIFLPKKDKSAGPWRYPLWFFNLLAKKGYNFLFLQFLDKKLIEMLDLPLVIFINFMPKFDENAGLPLVWFLQLEAQIWLKKKFGLTPCDIFNFWPQKD